MADSNKQTGDEALSVRDALRSSLSANTRNAYRTGWRRFAAYCEETGKNPMAATPADVADFLVRMASHPRSPRATTRKGEPLALSTLRVSLAAINRTYREQNRPSPVDDLSVDAVLRGLGRRSDRRPRQVKALQAGEVARILACCDEQAASGGRGLIAVRDAAVMALGFAAALRRSELCALGFADVEYLGLPGEASGMFLHIRRSKTDQLGRGQRVAVPEGPLLRPVARLRRWLELAGIEQGPLFQTMRSGGHVQGRPLHPTDVARVVKRYTAAIGLDPTNYSGHSLRAGFVTSAAANRARLDKIMEVTRHTSPRMVLRYIRQADAFEDHAGAAFL